MKAKLYDITIIILITLFWIVLNEEVSLLSIILGVILGLIFILGMRKFYANKNKSGFYRINIIFLLKFYLFLLYKIIISGFKIIPIIISGRENVKIVDIDTEIDNEMYITLLANAITLTPGTITVEQNGKHLKVLWVNCTTDNNIEAGEIIKGDFERVIKRGGA